MKSLVTLSTILTSLICLVSAAQRSPAHDKFIYYNHREFPILNNVGPSYSSVINLVVGLEGIRDVENLANLSAESALAYASAVDFAEQVEEQGRGKVLRNKLDIVINTDLGSIFSYPGLAATQDVFHSDCLDRQMVMAGRGIAAGAILIDGAGRYNAHYGFTKVQGPIGYTLEEALQNELCTTHVDGSFQEYFVVELSKMGGDPITSISGYKSFRQKHRLMRKLSYKNWIETAGMDQVRELFKILLATAEPLIAVYPEPARQAPRLNFFSQRHATYDEVRQMPDIYVGLAAKLNALNQEKQQLKQMLTLMHLMNALNMSDSENEEESSSSEEQVVEVKEKEENGNEEESSEEFLDEEAKEAIRSVIEEGVKEALHEACTQQ